MLEMSHQAASEAADKAADVQVHADELMELRPQLHT